MTRSSDLAITALAPIIWGTTYSVTTQMLPQGYPITVSLLRALPAGLLLLLIVRQWPERAFVPKLLVLGALNFSLFWIFLFISAYRLPGGVAATVGAIQPLIVVVLNRAIRKVAINPLSIVIGFMGLAGVAMLVLGPHAALDGVGVAAGLAGAASMAMGTVLSRHWQPETSALTFTAWQLTAGGLLLLPLALIFEPALPALTAQNWLGFIHLGLIGGALTYLLWFRGIARIQPSVIAPLGFFSPLTATLLGWILLSESLTPLQLAGMALVLVSVWLNSRL